MRDPAQRAPGSGAPAHVSCRLHGSLAFTGKGHATDRAVILGLAGFTPDTLDAEKAHAAEAAVRDAGGVATAREVYYSIGGAFVLTGRDLAVEERALDPRGGPFQRGRRRQRLDPRALAATARGEAACEIASCGVEQRMSIATSGAICDGVKA